jgi:hypothetical protein
MKFPNIKHINDVLPVIDGRKEFVRNEKHGLVFIDYVLETNDTFSADDDLESQLRRECRGIIFCANTGMILARRFEKFFNYRQKNFGLEIFQGDFKVYEKMDGSMISPVWSRDLNRFYWATRMGSPDFDGWVSNFVKKNRKYKRLASYCLLNGLTPIFEYTSKNNIIVCNYPKETMTLLAIRKNKTGKYMSRKELDFIAEFYDIRLSFYEKRKVYLKSKIQRDVEILTNKVNFIRAFLNNTI